MDRARRGARCQAVNEGALQACNVPLKVERLIYEWNVAFHSMFHSSFAVVLVPTERSC